MVTKAHLSPVPTSNILLDWNVLDTAKPRGLRHSAECWSAGGGGPCRIWLEMLEKLAMSDASVNLGAANDGVDTKQQIVFFFQFFLFFIILVVVVPRRNHALSISKRA